MLATLACLGAAPEERRRKLEELAKLPIGSVDCTLTDPPYGSSGETMKQGKQGGRLQTCE